MVANIHLFVQIRQNNVLAGRRARYHGARTATALRPLTAGRGLVLGAAHAASSAVSHARAIWMSGSMKVRSG